MTNIGKISFIVPMWNSETTIRPCLTSVLGQPPENFDIEVIVVNDGSTDTSASIVESISDSRVTLVNSVRCGRAHAKNTGLAKSHGEWVVFLDADTVIESKFLEKLSPLLRVGIIIGPQVTESNHTSLVARTTARIENFRLAAPSGACVVYDRATLSAVSFFDERIWGGEDLDLFIRACKAATFLYVPELHAETLHPHAILSAFRRRLRFGIVFGALAEKHHELINRARLVHFITCIAMILSLAMASVDFIFLWGIGLFVLDVLGTSYPLMRSNVCGIECKFAILVIETLGIVGFTLGWIAYPLYFKNRPRIRRHGSLEPRQKLS